MTESTDSRSRILILLALAGLVAATRGQQFAPLGQHLPDATLAAFFLAGFYLRALWVPIALFALATVIDLMAVGWAGVSSYCLSPAYGLLVPAYGALWAAGRWYRSRYQPGTATLPLLFAALLGGGLVAEAFASGGFYLFSGHFQPSLVGFGYSLVSYLPGTLMALFSYVGLAVIAHLTLNSAREQGRVGSR
jgi:hypothetical protein